MLGVSSSKFFSHWNERQLAGKGVKPKAAGNAAELLDFVRSSPGAVGFAAASELSGANMKGVRTVEIK